MEVRSAADAEHAEAADGVRLAMLVEGDQTNVQHFEIAPGAVVPEHSHPHEQTGLVVAGTLTIVLEDGTERAVGPGDAFTIPGDEPHSAENRDETTATGFDVFSPPRENPPWNE